MCWGDIYGDYTRHLSLPCDPFTCRYALDRFNRWLGRKRRRLQQRYFDLNINDHYGKRDTSAPLVNVDDELAKIVATCLTSREYEQLTGNIVRHTIARAFLSTYLTRECVATIGLTELRAALGFAPPGPWQPFNETKPSEGELAAAPTVEAYYDLREPRSEMRSLNSYYLLESNLIPAIPFLDERFPAIRTIFRRKFAEIREQNPGVIDRKIVDRMIDEFVAIYRRMRTATFKMTTSTECWTYEYD